MPCDVHSELADIFDQLEKLLLELGSPTFIATTPRPQRKRMCTNDIDTLALGAASAGDVAPVRKEPHRI